MNFNTRLLHGKGVKNYADGATLPPIAQVSAFRYQTAEELDKVFHHKAMGYAYSRVSNPSVAAFEQRINELEKGNAAVACSSGMAAIALALLNILSCGDEIIASSGLYGGSIDLLEDLSKFGIRTKYARHLTPEEAEPLFHHPLLEPVLDIAREWFRDEERVTFHDPLTAVSLFNEDVCTFETGILHVDTESSLLRGFTYWRRAEDGKHKVAMKVDRKRFFRHLFEVFDA